MKGEQNLSASFFGKLPSQGDFLKGQNNNQQLIAALDNWAGQALEKLARNVDWQASYDRAQAVDFVLMGSRNRHVVAGHLLPSRDVSGRRYPFMAAVAAEVDQPLPFIARSALVFSRSWNRLQRLIRQAHAAPEPGMLLTELAQNKLNVNLSPETLHPAFQYFLDMQTLDTLQQMLSLPGREVKVSQVILALGILLQPIMSAGSSGIGKGLILPLPQDPMYRSLVACLWLDLLSGFLGRASFDLLVMTHAGSIPMLVIGFKGLRGDDLAAMFDATLLQQGFVDLQAAPWVEEHTAADPGLKKVAAYLLRPDLSLHEVQKIFHETFWGA